MNEKQILLKISLELDCELEKALFNYIKQAGSNITKQDLIRKLIREYCYCQPLDYDVLFHRTLFRILECEKSGKAFLVALDNKDDYGIKIVYSDLVKKYHAVEWYDDQFTIGNFNFQKIKDIALSKLKEKDKIFNFLLKIKESKMSIFDIIWCELKPWDKPIIDFCEKSNLIEKVAHDGWFKGDYFEMLFA
jgi:hypothetical protein